MDEKLFVYGTLQDPTKQMELIARTLDGVPDTLTDFRHYGLLAYPVILPYPGDTVPGQVLTITATELAKFDEYEGETYLRVRVTLVSGLEVWVYQGDPQVYGKLLDGG
jgi:gamma-glutamylcyclotransferase (GGCT)/AIG2-like uncharacterized protein YtfP